MKRRENVVEVRTDRIAIVPELQTRVAIDEGTVEDYRLALENGAKFPPIDIARLGPDGKLAVVSGHHRLLAHRAAGRQEIKCYVRDEIKNVSQALEFATKANREHGLRPSLKDRQHNLRQWFNHYRLANKSDRAIAAVVGVDHKTVAVLREKLVSTGEFPSSAKRIGADGKARGVKSKPEKAVPEPAPKASESTANEAPVVGAPEAVAVAARVAAPKLNGEVVERTRGDKVADLLARARVVLACVPDAHLDSAIETVRDALDQIKVRAAQEAAR